MSITTRSLLISTLAVTGQAMPNARARFLLSAPDKEGTTIVSPQVQTCQLDGSGNGTEMLWPNSLGIDGTTFYVVQIIDQYNKVQVQGQCIMPNADLTPLATILSINASPPDANEAEVAVMQAMAAAGAAQGFAGQAEVSAVAADASADSAALSELHAASSEVAAAADAAASSASATLSQSWAISLTPVAGGGGLFGSRYYANASAASATAAATSAGAANTSANAASASATLAQQWATSLVIVSGGFYGAMKYAQDASTSAGTAGTAANAALDAAAAANGSANASANSATLSSNWASSLAGAVAGGLFSAREYAAGSQAGTGGSSKNWAQQIGADVTGAAANSRSAKSWSQEVLTGATLGGSSKDWAQTTGGTVDGVSFSSKELAQGSTAGTGGSAKGWAVTAGADVPGAAAGSRSAKSWSIDNLTPSGAALGGSAKDWSQSPVKPDGVNESSKTYAGQSAASSATSSGYATAADIARQLASQFADLCAQALASSTAVFNSMVTQFASLATITALVSTAQASADTATNQANFAKSSAASAVSALTQDLSGVISSPLHRSPGAIVALPQVDDASKHSDGGAWIDRATAQSWAVEALNGNNLQITSPDGFLTELDARAYKATLGAEVCGDPTFSGSAGWTLTSSTIAPGTLTVTGAAAGAVASRTDAVTVQPYQVTVVVGTLTAGAFTVRLGNATTLRTLSAPGAYTFTVGAPAAAGSISLGATGASTTGTVTKFAVKPITAFTTASGDFYQLSTDGKWYRLWRNVVANSGFAGGTAGTLGTTATAVIPSWITGNTASSGSITLPSTTKGGTYVGGSAIRYSAAAQIPFIQTQNPYATAVLVGQVWIASFYVESVASGTAPSLQCYVVPQVAAATRTYRKNGSAALATDVPVAGDFIEITLTITGAGNMELRYGPGANSAPATVDMTLSPLQLEQGLGLTSATAYEPKAAGIGSQSETFRGNKAKYSHMMQPVVEGTSITLYDVTEPGRPMWMRFPVAFGKMIDAAAVTSVVMGQGQMLVGTASGAFLIDFVKDTCTHYRSGSPPRVYPGRISDRNSALTYITLASGPIIANNTVNALAMCVCPDAPLDPVSLLQVPMFAFATAGGVTILQNNGTAVSSSSTSGYADVQITPQLLASSNATQTINYALAPGKLSASWSFSFTNYNQGSNSIGRNMLASRSLWARRSGLSQFGLMKWNESAPTTSLYAQIDATYNTGWMTGDIRRCLFAEAVAVVLPLELVTATADRDFSADTGWWSKATGVTISGGACNFAAVASGFGLTRAGLVATVQPFSIVKVTYSITSYTGGGIQAAAGGNAGSTRSTVGGPYTDTITAGTNGIIGFFAQGTTTLSLDDVSFQVISINDRSWKQKAATVNGSLTYTAAVTGGNLMAVGGFTNDPAQTVNKVTNGTFATDLANWTKTIAGGTSDVTWVGGAASFLGDGVNNVYLSQGIACTVGRKTTLFLDVGTNALNAGVGTTATGLETVAGASFTAGTAKSISFVATAATHYITFYKSAASTSTLDNVSGWFADAIGSAANVAQDPVNSVDLAYGTGTWQEGMWFNLGTGTLGSGAPAPGGVGPAVSYLPLANFPLTAVASDMTTAQWTKSTGWTATGPGAFSLDGSAGAAQSNLTMGSGQTPSAGAVRKWTITITALALNGGTLIVFPNNSSSTIAITATGTYTGIGGDNTCIFRVAGGTGVTCTGSLVIEELGVGAASDYSSLAAGASRRLGCNALGKIVGKVSDGTTPRVVTSTATYLDGQPHKARVEYNIDGSLTLKMDGEVNATTTGAPLLTLTNANALATYGNALTLDAAFPGTFLLWKSGATLPFAEQSRLMYAQERAMFQPGAQVTLPDAGTVLDMSYDDTLDRIKVVTAANECIFQGLVRAESAAAVAGTISKCAMRSGVKVIARVTTNPGVDISFGAQNLKEQLLRRAEDADKAPTPRVTNFDAIAFTATTNTTAGTSNQLTSVSVTAGTPFIGMGIAGTGIPVGTTILGINGTTYYMSANATAIGAGVTMTQTTFAEVPGWTFTNGTVESGRQAQREGTGKDYTVLYNGFYETALFGAGQAANTWVRTRTMKATP